MGNACCGAPTDSRGVELPKAPTNDPNIQKIENLKFLHQHVNENMHGAFE
jgi:hypothetical protein